MTSATAPSPTAAAQRLADALTGAGKVRLPLAGLLSCWDQVMPELRGQPDALTRLAAAVDELAAVGIITLPAGAWDRSTRPALPRFVTVPAARRLQRPKPWRTFPWRPELGWAASLLSMTSTQFDALVAVNDWLAVGADHVVVPARIRSAELWGDEKLIDALVDTAIWGEGRLSWGLLRAERLPPPLAIRRVGSGPEVLVVENIDPFWLCTQLLTTAATTIGRIAWGAGKAFVAAAPSITQEPDPPTRIWYWGDGDPEGVRIPTSAAAAVLAAGLPRLEPAAALWSSYAEAEVTDRGRYNWSTVSSEWLGPDCWAALGDARSLNGRIAQESIGPATLRALLS